MSCQNTCNSNSAIEQAVDDALADRITDLDGFAQSANTSAQQAAASAITAEGAATEAKGYRDQAQQVANTASGLVPDILEASNNIKEASEILDAIAQTASSFLVRNIYYTVAGGENTLSLADQPNVLAVQAIYIEGSRQDNGYGFTYSASTKIITFAETFTAEQAGTVLTIQVGTANVDSPESVLSMLSGSGGAGYVGAAGGTSVQDELDSLKQADSSQDTEISGLQNIAQDMQTSIDDLETDLSSKVSQADFTSAMLLKAPLASPQFTGIPTAPSPTQVTANDGQVATTAFVQAVVAKLVDSSPAALDTLNELAAALGDDPNFAATVSAALGLKAPLASPVFTGVPLAPTPALTTNTTQVATTAFVKAVVDALGQLKANKGANNDITSLTGLTTPLSIEQGGTGQSGVSYVRAEDTTSVSVAATTFTALAPTEVVDTKNGYLNGVWTCPETGYYQISGFARFAAPAVAACGRILKIDVSPTPVNTAVPGQSVMTSGAPSDVILNVSCVLQVTAGAKLALYGYHTDSGALNITHKALQILRVA